MADKKISQLASGTNAQAGDLFVIARSGANYSLTTAQLFNAPSATATLAALTVDTNTLFVDATNNRVGVGTATPSFALDVVSAAEGVIRIRGGGSTNQGSAFFVSNSAGSGTLAAFGDSARMLGGAPDAGVTVFAGNVPLSFYVNSATRATIDTSGNLGLGVTPSAWTTFAAFQLSRGSVAGNTSEIDVSHNAFYDGAWKYIANGFATNHYQTNGTYVWRTAPSGTAGAAITFTQAMTLDANGRLGIGTTAPAVPLDVVGVAKSTSVFAVGDASGNYSGTLTNEDNTSKSITFNADPGNVGAASFMRWNVDGTERMRLDASGNLGVGTTAPANKMSVIGKISVSDANFTAGAYIHANAASGANRQIAQFSVAGVSNGFEANWDHATSKIHVIINNIPTASAGLPAGTLWSDSGTIKIA